jgi:hypothetical protein
MKKVLFIVALFAATVSQSFSQNINIQSTPILIQYFSIKDALVTGNAALGASRAEDLQKSISSLEPKALTETSRIILLKEVSQISASKDINAQRAAFANLSSALLALAKTEKLSTKPVYQLYCPMKKSYWLSSEKVVKNPYYGSSMLNCGKVEGTI